MNVPKTTVVAMASLGSKSRVASAIFVVLALLLVSLAICAPAARAQSWGQVVLHSFAYTDGADPESGLIQGRDGNFYGTTVGGGKDPDSTNGHATVFKITPSGMLTTLYRFCSGEHCPDGADPVRLIQGSDGNFYGTTLCGGARVHGLVNQDLDSRDPCTADPAMNPGGTVFKITPSGALTTLYSFCSVVDRGNNLCTDGAWPIAGVIQGIDGNFYGATKHGGVNASVKNDPRSPKGPGTVFKLTPSGKLTTLYSFCSRTNCGDGDGANGLIQGSDGNFYGTTSGGGTQKQGTVFKLTPSGTLTTLYSFCSVREPDRAKCLDGAEPNGVIQGDDGNFYGTSVKGFDTDSTAFKLTPSGMLTTVYSFCPQRYTCTCPDGDAPSGLIEGSDGNFYGTTSIGGANGYDSQGAAKGYGTVFKLGASLPTPTNTPAATSTPGHIEAITNESACDVSKAKADDLLALAPLGSSFPVSPGVKCTVEGLSPAAFYCDNKTKIVRDQLLGQGRRLIVSRTTYTGKSAVDDNLFVFGCTFGRVVRILTTTAGVSGGKMKIEHADADEITFVGPPTPPGVTGPLDGRDTLDWDAKTQGYESRWAREHLPPYALEPNNLPALPTRCPAAN